MTRRWPQEVIDWLTENVPGKTTKEVTEIINTQGFDIKYGMAFDEAKIKMAKSRYSIQSGTRAGVKKGYSKKYPPGMAEYMRSIAPGKNTVEIAKMTAEHFGIEFSYSQCKGYMNRNKITNGIDCRFKKGQVPANKGKKMSQRQYKKLYPTMFKKGHISARTLKVGEYTHTSDGYLIRKVKATGKRSERYIFVHRQVWEEHNGPIPDGKMISFLDGNKDNCSIENLVMLDKAENARLNQKHMRFKNPELTKTGVVIVKLRILAKQKKEE